MGRNSYKDIMGNNITHKETFNQIHGNTTQNNWKTPNIDVINAYTPDVSYDGGSHNKQWDETRGIIKQIPLRHVIFWCTDNNGQLAQGNGNKEHLGIWTMGNITEEGMGNN